MALEHAILRWKTLNLSDQIEGPATEGPVDSAGAGGEITSWLDERFGNQRVVHPPMEFISTLHGRGFETCALLGTVLGLTTTAMTHHTTGTLEVW